MSERAGAAAPGLSRPRRRSRGFEEAREGGALSAARASESGIHGRRGGAAAPGLSRPADEVGVQEAREGRAPRRASERVGNHMDELTTDIVARPRRMTATWAR
jgi:hypothetical protein